MDEFLKVVMYNYMDGNFIQELPCIIESKDEIKNLISPKLYEKWEDDFYDNIVQQNQYAFVEGMKLAISIMEKKYVPRI